MPTLNANLLKPLAKCNQPLVSKGALTITGENENALPLDLLLVIDMSGSMHGEGESIVKDSTIFILDKLMRPDDKLAIITFSSSAEIHTDWVNQGGSVVPFKAGGGTNFGAAINKTLEFLGSYNKDSSRSGIVLFLSDGHGGKASDENVRTITEFGFTMHTLGVTSGADPSKLDHMAELARGFFFNAPTFDEVKKAIGQITKYGQSVIYAAPDLKIKVEEGVILSDLVQTPQGLEIAKGPLKSGFHDVSLSHIAMGTRGELTFKVNVNNIECNDNLLVTFDCIGASSELRVQGSTDGTLILNSSVNTEVTLMTKTGQASRLIKTGDIAGATRIITQLKTLEKTHPNAASVTKTLTDSSSLNSQADRLASLGKLQTDKTGKTVVRED